MNKLLIYLGSFYILLGFIFILFPLIYLEIGRQKDLIKGSLNLLIGITLIIKNKVFDNLTIGIFFLGTVMSIFYIFEIFLIRWNQLTDKEKNKLTTLIEFKKNFIKILEAFILATGNFKNSLDLIKFLKNKENNKKKWVRNETNDNIKI